VEAALSAALAARVQFAGDLAQSERDLPRLTGIPEERTRASNLVGLALTDTTLAPADTLVARAFRANPAVVEAERKAAAARAGEGVAKASRLPTLELVGGWQVWADPDGHSHDEWNATVQLTQPLFTGGELSGGIRKASALRAQADEALRLVRITTQREVLRAVDLVRETEARAAGLETAASQYDEVARIEALALQTGTGTQTDFLAAEADLLHARASLAEARRAEITARVELTRLTGELTRNWLRNILETK
jgi:outer membrane protein